MFAAEGPLDSPRPVVLQLSDLAVDLTPGFAELTAVVEAGGEEPLRFHRDESLLGTVSFLGGAGALPRGIAALPELDCEFRLAALPDF